jgi:hypothetical protein
MGIIMAYKQVEGSKFVSLEMLEEELSFERGSIIKWVSEES